MKIAMIGAGQQGTSQGLGYILAGHDVVFYDTNPDRQAEVIKKAAEFGISEDQMTFADSPEEAMGCAEIIAANVPGDEFVRVTNWVNDYAQQGAVFYDNGSGKTRTMRDIKGALSRDDVDYVGGHFFVGKAGSGPSFATPEMYKGQTAGVFADEDQNDARDIAVGLFEDLGVKTVQTDWTPEQHDQLLGRFSHANTFMTIALMLSAQDIPLDGTLAYTQRFLSSTRVAANGVDGSLFWGPIAMDNKDAILASVDDVAQYLKKVKEAIQTNDRDQLTTLFNRAKGFAKTIDQNQELESLDADFADMRARFSSTDPLFASKVFLPYVFSVCSVLAADDHEKNGGIPYSEVGNSSFKDAARPAGLNPYKMLDEVLSRKDHMVAAISKLEEEFEKMAEVIASSDREQIDAYHDEGHRVRSVYPDAPTAARPEFITA